MNIQFRAACAAAALAICSAAQSTLFLGYDDNTTGVVPLTNRPNHDAAKQAFLAAAGTVGTQDFEGLANGPISGFVSFGAVTDALFTSGTGSGITESQVRDSAEYDCFATSGSKYYMVHCDPGVTAITITFSKSIRSIGFSYTDESDWFGIGNNAGHLIDFGYGEKINMNQGLDTSKIHSGSAFFIGFISPTPFASMTISYSPQGQGTGINADAVGIDDMMVGLVPEPASVVLLATGLGLVVMRRRSR